MIALRLRDSSAKSLRGVAVSDDSRASFIDLLPVIQNRHKCRFYASVTPPSTHTRRLWREPAFSAPIAAHFSESQDP